MFWADSIVQEVIDRRRSPFTVYDWWTPSGFAHSGHTRTFLLHQAIYYGLKLHGQEATYYYGFDDMDPMDGFPPDCPEEWRQYMGLPLFRVPSYVPGYDSLGGYYAAKYLEAMEVLEVYPEVPTTSQMYLTGQFNEAITIVLENAEKIRAIYADLGAERPTDWYAFQTVCENCGKIGTTRVFEWDGEQVSYKCEPKLVSWAEGCGYEGRISPYNGNGKLLWKVEWPAKWFLLGTDYEGGGKDHFTKNGSRDYGRRIITDIFHAEEPVGYPHEFFLAGGKKQASSKGIGMTANDAAVIMPPYLLRYFVFRVPPNRQIEFTLEGDSIPKIYDDFDRAIQLLRTEPDSNEARALIYAHQSDAPLPEYTMRFSKVTFLIQMPHIDLAQMAEQEKGSPLTEADHQELAIRTEYARRWLASYADESAKFTLQPTLPAVELAQNQRVFLAHLAEQLAQTEWSGEAIHGVVHDLKNTMELAPREAFGALYQIFLAREQGPQIGWFLASLDRDFVLNRLREAQGVDHA